MAIIVRIDVDRPYGRAPLFRHLVSRFSSDFFFPRIQAFGYLKELNKILQILRKHQARAYAFFRWCTLPSTQILEMMEEGGHEIGLHLENSRSFETFEFERSRLERHIGKEVLSFSKHGSGGAKYGRHHYAPYEPERYVEWAKKSRFKAFFGNLEDPTREAEIQNGGLTWYPAAFWLEPYWRDTKRFTIDWLLARARKSDIVLLLHPENVLGAPTLLKDFEKVLSELETKIIA
jgi:hypothetical protein